MRWGASAVGIALLAACGVYGGSDDSPPPTTQAGDAGGGGPCDPSVLYVRSNGDDANAGCDPSKPKRTLSSAIGAVQAKGSPSEIRTCAETVRERVILAYPATIVGGFDCASWAPGAAKTKLEAPDDREVETIIVFGKAVDGSVRLEHLRIDGPTRAAGIVSALRVKDGAAPVLRNLELYGGKTDEGQGIALSIESASPVVEDSVVHGARARCTKDCTAVTATGIGINGGAPKLRRTIIDGGEVDVAPAGNAVGSIALDVVGGSGGVKAVGADAFTGLEIRAGIGRVGGIYPAFALRASQGAEVELVDSKIVPNDVVSTCVQSPCQTMGAVAGSNAKLKIARSRVVASESAGAPGTTAVLSRAVGVHASGSANLSLFSTLVHSPVTGLDASAGTVAVEASTIVAPEVIANSIGSIGVHSSILAHSRSGIAPVFVYACDSPAATSITASVFVGSSTGFANVFTPQGTCTGNASPTLSALAASATALNVFSAKSVSRIAASCTNEDGDCTVAAACTSGEEAGTACLREVFASVSDPLFGRKEILSADGLRLKPNVSCKVSQGGDALADVTTDLFGAPRTNPVSMGAHEYDGTCSP